VNLDDILNKRQSIRRYTKKVPSKADINKVIDAAVKAPSSCNLQLWEFIYVSKPETMEAFAKKVTGKMNWASACIVVAYDPRLTVGRRAGLVSVGAAMQNLMLKATELGMGTCPMAGFRGDEFVKKSLGIPEEYEIPVIILIGYPEGESNKTYRSKPEKVLHFDEFESHRPQLKTSIHLDDWEQDAVLEYRSRIFSVYLWRLNLRFFDDENVARIWNGIEEYLPAKAEQGLILYPWEDSFIKKLKAYYKSLTLADFNKEVAQHYAEKYEVMGEVMVPGSPLKSKNHDTAFILNKLEFETKPSELLANANAALKPGGTLVLTTFDRRSLYITLLRWAIKLKYFPDVYHKSPFYKWGPIKFYSKRKIKALLAENKFEIQATKDVQLNLSDSMIDAFKGNKLVYMGLKVLTTFMRIGLKKEELHLIIAKKQGSV
jgi:nitroreductase